MEFPIRINKYLAFMNFSTRRGADELIKRGLVTINGRRAVLGDMINAEDKVSVKGQDRSFSYFAYYKPKGIICEVPKEIKMAKGYRINDNLSAAGELEKDAQGLVLISDDNRISKIFASENNNYEKEYIVKTRNTIQNNFTKLIGRGLEVEEGTIKNCKAKEINTRTFKIITHEEIKHQIKRICASLHNDSTDIKRVRIMNIKLGDISPGQWRKIEGDELNDFKSSLFA